MKILFLSLHTNPFSQPGKGDAGGLNVYVANLARKLAGEGNEIEVLTLVDNEVGGFTQKIEKNLSLTKIQITDIGKISKKSVEMNLDLIKTKLIVYLKDKQYDLVHAHYWLSGLVGVVLKEHTKIPLVYTAHTWAFNKNKIEIPGVAKESEDRLAGEAEIVTRVDKIVTNTVYEKEAVLQEFNLPENKISVVNPGIDVDLFSNPKIANTGKKLSVMNSLNLLFVGRLQPLKAPDLAIKILAALARRNANLQISLKIIGGISSTEDCYLEYLKTLAKELQVENLVTFSDPLASPLLAKEYTRADFLLMTSYSESFGMVALEAQASGTIPVAVRKGALIEALGNGRGSILVENHKPILWAKAIEDLTYSDNYQAFSKEAVDNSQEYSWDKMSENYRKIYTDLSRES